MKQYLSYSVIVLLTVGIWATSFRCVKDSDKGDNESDCKDVICTMEFVSVSVHIQDNSANPLKLDVYTIRKSTGEKITMNQPAANAGTYFILDDGYRLKILNRTETFILVGTKAGKEIFRETYQIHADCCHVSKVSGKDAIVIP